MNFPGPPELGRGLVILPGTPLPPGFPEESPRVKIDSATLTHPAAALKELHTRYLRRQPVIVELAVPKAQLWEPQTDSRAPYELLPSFEFEREQAAISSLGQQLRPDGPGE